MFGDVNLQNVDHLKILNTQANGLDWGTLSGGGPISVDIYVGSGDGYNTLYGTHGDDTIRGSQWTSTVDISQGGHDTLVFEAVPLTTPATRYALEMNATGFHANNTDGSGGADMLDFTALGLVPKSGTTGLVHYGVQGLTDGIQAMGSGAVTDVNVLGFTNLYQSESASLGSIASAINAATYSTDVFANNQKMIFLIASTGDQGVNTAGTNTDVYLWQDTGGVSGGHASVSAGELSKIGVLKDFTQFDIGHLTASSFVDHSVLPT
jgi:hypothetical protein